MSLDITDLRPTIIPKSDQLNAEQLLGGPITVKITSVRVSDSAEQPIIIGYEGDGGRPYKPCKTCRKIIMFGWGHDGTVWSGRSMTLYHDANVSFGGMRVGGIRISHMSDIPQRMEVNLTATKGKKALHTVQPLKTAPAGDSLSNAIDAAPSIEQCKSAFETAYKSTRDTAARASFKSRYDKRMAVLKMPDPDALAIALDNCATLADLEAEADKLRHITDDDTRSTLTDIVMRKREQLEQAA
jgi:hypothetical protein